MFEPGGKGVFCDACCVPNYQRDVIGPNCVRHVGIARDAW